MPKETKQGKNDVDQLFNGVAKMRNTAGKETSVKLASCCESLCNLADVQYDPDREEQPESDGECKLPAILSVVIQSYDGETCEGQFHGEGSACFEEGHTYKGVFSKGLMDGPGVLTCAYGLKYEGGFVQNIPMGQGSYTWPDGSSYQGEVHRGIRHGTGTYKSSRNEMSYSGQWYQGKRHGKGTLYYNKDKTSWYKGDWVKNHREGWGVRCYPSGDIYSGEWKNNLRHGEGTMKWLKLGQKYDGNWQDGIQHGHGTHVWIVRRVNRSQSNRYEGDFVQGQRHGQGTFYYAGGAIYEGEWKNNKKHGQGKFTSKDGRVFEGEFVDDKMVTSYLDGNTGRFPLLGSDSTVGPTVTLNIQYLLTNFPEKKHATECQQVKFVLQRHDAELRSIYNCYSRLGCSTDYSLPLSRLQLWRLLKDCNIHHHGITLIQIDHFIREDLPSEEIHSPFTPFLLRNLLNYLVIVAYHIYNKQMVSQKNLLATCLSKLITDDILPNAKNVKGLLFSHPDLTGVAMNHMKRCWEVYQAYCEVSAASRDDTTITYRHLLWMLKDLHLLDHNLNTLRLLEIISADSCDPSNLSSCLDLKITFLEFFEVLLNCAEIKCQEEEDQPQTKSDTKTWSYPLEVDTSEKITMDSTSQSAGNSSAQEVGTQQEVDAKEDPRAAEHTGVRNNRMESKDCDMELRTKTIHQFLNNLFFPAFEHYQLVTRNMMEEKLKKEC
ncbi:radial spoke head 10 homolog B [Parambassis ranga]|uniref:Radial spoke head 10 homolog B n=1 Tax=Parambassis ranga TaxID=210632 RepID=A0A6P7KAR5_9TELE|nr:radial spoke head 10 homolog B [Parambassis ranga]